MADLGTSPDENAKMLVVVNEEKARRRAKAEAEAKARAARRAAAIAAREAACAAAAAPAAEALRFALKDSTYKLPELERVLARLQELERPTSLSSSPSAPSMSPSTPPPVGVIGRAVSGERAAKGASSARLGTRTPITSRRASGGSGKDAVAHAWGEFGGSSSDGSTCGDPSLMREAMVMEHAEAAIFVHFIPPPLRAEGKRDLPWIVHTCTADGCREARRVSFHSLTGFTTYETAPPEVAEGLACNCQIANHHLRGYGRVRWEGDHAIVEDVAGGGGATVVDGRAYLAQAKKLATQLKALQAREKEARRSLKEARTTAGAGAAPTCVECESDVAC